MKDPALDCINANLNMIQDVNTSVKNLCDAQVATTSTIRALIATCEGYKRDIKKINDVNSEQKKKIRDLEKKYQELHQYIDKKLLEHRLND